MIAEGCCPSPQYVNKSITGRISGSIELDNAKLMEEIIDSEGWLA